MPAAFTRPVIGPWPAALSAMPLTTAVSLATSNGAGHKMVPVPSSGSGAMSAMTARWPCSTSSAAVAAPMPRQPPVTSTTPSAVMAVCLVGCVEQPARHQSLIGRNNMLRHGNHRAAGVGIAAAEIAARAHQHLYDGLEFLVAEITGRSCIARAPQDTRVGDRDIVKMLLVADRRKEIGRASC